MGSIEALHETVAHIEQLTAHAENHAQGAQWELTDIIKTIAGF